VGQLGSGPILTRRGVADRYRVSVRTVDRWLAARLIPAIRLGRCLRFDAAQVDAALARFTVQEITK
jgi:excisionase family DNA binding protein